MYRMLLPKPHSPLTVFISLCDRFRSCLLVDKLFSFHGTEVIHQPWMLDLRWTYTSPLIKMVTCLTGNGRTGSWESNSSRIHQMEAMDGLSCLLPWCCYYSVTGESHDWSDHMTGSGNIIAIILWSRSYNILDYRNPPPPKKKIKINKLDEI